MITFRENEIQVRDFQLLSRTKKLLYIEFLKTLDPGSLSFNDKGILNLMKILYLDTTPTIKNKIDIPIITKPTPTEIPVEIHPPIHKKTPTVKYNMSWYREVINELYSNYYNWEYDLTLMGKEMFIDNVLIKYPDINKSLNEQLIDGFLNL